MTDQQEDELIWHNPAFYTNLQKRIREETFAKGLPLVYMTRDRKLVHEYEDGRIIVIKQL